MTRSKAVRLASSGAPTVIWLIYLMGWVLILRMARVEGVEFSAI
jgi:hypothetical protein